MVLLPTSRLYDNKFVLFYATEFAVMFMMAIRNSYAGPKFWACQNVTSTTITANNNS